MVHLHNVVQSTLPVLLVETMYSDMAPDKVQNLESSPLELLGANPLSVHFAELVLSFSKRYDSFLLWCTC